MKAMLLTSAIWITGQYKFRFSLDVIRPVIIPFLAAAIVAANLSANAAEDAAGSRFVVERLRVSYGFLEGSINAPNISMIWLLPALIGTYGGVSCILPLRFK